MIAPNPDGVNLTKTVEGLDHFGNTVVSQVIEEKPLTIYLNSQEIVTAMTIGDYPEYLAVGFLRNQGMLDGLNTVSSVDYDEDLSVVVVRTKTETSFEDKLKKKTSEIVKKYPKEIAVSIKTKIKKTSLIEDIAKKSVIYNRR